MKLSRYVKFYPDEDDTDGEFIRAMRRFDLSAVKTLPEFESFVRSKLRSGQDPEPELRCARRIWRYKTEYEINRKEYLASIRNRPQ